MKIQKAQTNQLDEIMGLLRECAKDMNEQGIYQWDETYPPRDYIEADCKSESLFCYKEDSDIIGIIVISKEQESEYENVNWTDNRGKFLVVHRLAVRPKWQRSGLGRQMMIFAEEYATENGYFSIRLDTYSGNPVALEFYMNLGYQRIPGHIHFPHRELPYFCFEKILKNKL
jgi:ribosomal protein S18 acetylase RimI-like enzyme